VLIITFQGGHRLHCQEFLGCVNSQSHLNKSFLESALGSCEIFDPSTYQWSTANRLQVSRYNHTSTLLPSGHVLVAGGLGEGGALNDAEVYDPTSDTWINVNPMKIARRDQTATLLLDGTVLVAGGMDSSNTLLRDVEVFDPRNRNWSLITSMNHPHSRHTATLFRNSHVLIVGTRGQQTAEVYDPSTRRWEETSPLSIERHSGHAATSLEDGSVLISGGQGPGDAFLATTERYFHVQDRWEFFGTLAIDRTMHTATLLKDGTVLVVGGGTAYSA
jgi:large repetitive protein